MGIGASLFLLAVGAILTFAFNVQVGWLDLDVVGWVLMVVGAVGLILTFTVFNRARRMVRRTSTTADPRVGDEVVEERSTYDVDRPL